MDPACGGGGGGGGGGGDGGMLSPATVSCARVDPRASTDTNPQT